VAAGLGAYRNTPEHTLAQVARARRPEKGHRLDGVSFFSYAAPRIPPGPSPNVNPRSALDPAATAGDRLAYLADGVGSVPAAFANPAPVPPMPWIDRPTHGAIVGAVNAPPGEADGAIVKIKRAGFNLFARTRTLEADGSGVFGLTLVKPGRYRVRVERGGQMVATTEARVTAGQVTRADVRLAMNDKQ
jgi:hypothetical protein